MIASRHPAVRWLYLLGGCLMVALAVIGALLPVMPTTIFLILALACFSKSSPRLEQRLLDHPRYGPGLRRWREQRIVPRKAKCFAALGMGGGFVALLLARPPHWVPWLVAAIELSVLLYLLSRPSRPGELAGWRRLSAGQWKGLALLLCVGLHLAALTAGWWWPGAKPPAPAPAEQPAMQWLAGGGSTAPEQKRIAERASEAASASRRAAAPQPAGIQPDSHSPQATQAAGKPGPAPRADQPPAPRAAADQAPSQAAAPKAASQDDSRPRVSQGRSSWEAQVLARLERYRQYPATSRLRGDEGTAYLSIRIDREGRVLAARLSRGSGHPALDQAALDTAYRAAPLPRIPDALPDTLELAVPVEFFLEQ